MERLGTRLVLQLDLVYPSSFETWYYLDKILMYHRIPVWQKKKALDLKCLRRSFSLMLRNSVNVKIGGPVPEGKREILLLLPLTVAVGGEVMSGCGTWHVGSIGTYE